MISIQVLINKYFPDNRFEYAVNVVLQHEGYFSNDKKDPGGVTQWGISLRFLQASGIDVLNDGIIDDKDVKAITKKQAKEIYFVYFWKKYAINKLSNLMIATKVLDMAVNMGGAQAIKILQEAINQLRLKPIAVDGVLGPITQTLANNIDYKELHERIRALQLTFYLNLIAQKPALEVFKNGWTNRAAW